MSGKQGIEQRAWSIGLKTQANNFFLYALPVLSLSKDALCLFQIRNPQSRNSYILLSQAKLAPTGIVIKSAVLSSLRLVPFINLQSTILNLQSEISNPPTFVPIAAYFGEW